MFLLDKFVPAINVQNIKVTSLVLYLFPVCRRGNKDQFTSTGHKKNQISSIAFYIRTKSAFLFIHPFPSQMFLTTRPDLPEDLVVVGGIVDSRSLLIFPLSFSFLSFIFSVFFLSLCRRERTEPVATPQATPLEQKGKLRDGHKTEDKSLGYMIFL